MKAKSKTYSKKSFFSFKVKIALLCTGSILIAVAINFALMFNASKNAITDSTEMTMMDLASSNNNNISEAVQQATHSAYFLMSTSSITDYVNSGGVKEAASVASLVSQFLSSNTSNEDISIVDAKGKVLYSSNHNMVGTDLSGETYFTKMVSNGLSTQGDVYISDTSKEACVTFAIPLRTDMQRPDQTNGSTETSATSSTDSSVNSDSTSNTANQSSNMPPSGASFGQDETAVSEFTGAIITSFNVSSFNSLLSDAKVGNYKSSYAFLLDSSGNVIYHPNNKLIGTKLDINEINSIVNKIKAGTNKASGMLTYTYNGIKQYSAYNINTKNHWILFITSNESEVLDSLNIVASKTLFISIILIIILSIFAYFITGTLTKSIKRITNLINKTSELDFSEDQSFSNLSLRRDEAGEMSRAIEKMRGIMKTMILRISEVSSKISDSSTNLDNISMRVNDHASDNSATAEELSASMEQTAATTEQIYSNIEQIGNNTKDITDKVSLGANVSTELMSRASVLKATTNVATTNTKRIYEEVKIKTDAAIEQAKAVEKIGILSKTIKDIAGQTSLLALNASIEAARAGDKGSGFSVVASEIGNLANESTKTVASISEIIEEVYQAVDNMSRNLEQTLSFLETNVLTDYNSFLNSSEEYYSDAETMNGTMESIQQQIDLLNSNVQGISESIAEINMMVNESSKGVNDVATSNTNIVSLTSNTQAKVKENTGFAQSLKEIVDKFKL